jgi:hypothetical protein
MTAAKTETEQPPENTKGYSLHSCEKAQLLSCEKTAGKKGSEVSLTPCRNTALFRYLLDDFSSII